MKIDGNAVLPIGWVFTGITVMISTAVLGTFWVSAVNFRLSRIEEKLGIPMYKSGGIGLPSEGESVAHAAEVSDDDKLKSVPRALQLLPSHE